MLINVFFFFLLQENYFICRGGERRNHGGKISNKISNLKQKKRKVDAREKEHLKSFNVVVTDNISSDSASTEAANWLSLNQEPWSVVLDKWTASFLLRRPLLQNKQLLFKLFSTFPHYKNSHGYQLVSSNSIDFFS